MSDDAPKSNFIRDIIEADLASGKHTSIVTRFPPEPNGFLHIGHAKSICLNFGLARDYGGRCHLRFDDTNPTAEDDVYVRAIQDDVRWLGFDWGEHLYFSSDLFEWKYGLAQKLIRAGKAYVCSLAEDQMREFRGTVMEPGLPSPDRDRPADESLELFARMKDGAFPDGAYTLRARIDMAADNMKLRDPPLYRIRHAHHHRQKDRWCIYPMYDWDHPLTDAHEGVTHSLCTLEFDNNRALYDWVIDNTDVPHKPRQYEFARLALTNTVMSKRLLLELVNEKRVSGWNDPRMPTLVGLRRRGVRPEAIRAFAEGVGVAKANSTVQIEVLDFAIRHDLNTAAPRVLGVRDPLELVITNWPAGTTDWIDAPLWPHDIPREGTRQVPFSGRLWVEREDYSAVPPKGWHRLAAGQEVRLRHGYIVRCEGADLDADGRPVRVLCTYDPSTRGGSNPADRKVKGTLHWVSADHAEAATFRQFGHLYLPEAAGALEGSRPTLNPDSLVTTAGWVEPWVATQPSTQPWQFERLGYFVQDPVDSRPGGLVFHRVVGLKDSWSARPTDAVPPSSLGRTEGAKPPADRPPKAPKAPAGPLAPEVQALMTQHGLKDADARALVADPSNHEHFTLAVGSGLRADLAARWIVNDLPRMGGLGKSSILALVELGGMVADGTITAKVAREVLVEMTTQGAAPTEVVSSRGLHAIRDPAALAALVQTTLDAHPVEVAALKGGKKQLHGFLLGHALEASRGCADPELLRGELDAQLAAR